MESIIEVQQDKIFSKNDQIMALEDELKTLNAEINELRSRLGMKPKRVDRKVARHRREGPKRVTHDRKAFTKPALRGEKSIEIDMPNPYITPIEKEIDIGDFGDHHLPRQTTVQ